MKCLLIGLEKYYKNEDFGSKLPKIRFVSVSLSHIFTFVVLLIVNFLMLFELPVLITILIIVLKDFIVPSKDISYNKLDRVLTLIIENPIIKI